jgi:pimeloyl-ACP methyl ester carboxylesterase
MWRSVPILLALAATPVSFKTQDGWTIHADAYGAGERGLVLIHGGRFTKESWKPQVDDFTEAGFRVLAIDMRGFGASKEGPEELKTGYGSHLDALAAVRYLRTSGCKTVSIVGGSMGASAAAAAAVASEPGEIDRLVLLAGGGDEPPEKLKGRKLFVVAKDDANAAGPRLPKIRKQYEGAPPPKELLLLDGSAHAQFLFETDQGDRLMREILRFLTQE